jgi:hypothetical protein
MGLVPTLMMPTSYALHCSAAVPCRWDGSFELLQLKNVKRGQPGMEFGVTPQILSRDIMQQALSHLKELYAMSLFDVLFLTNGATATSDVRWSEYTIYRQA